MQNKAMSCCEAPGNVFSSDFPSDDQILTEFSCLGELFLYVYFASSDLCALLTQTYARPEATAAHYSQYAATVTGDILRFYEGFFEISYQQNSLGKTE